MLEVLQTPSRRGVCRCVSRGFMGGGEQRGRAVDAACEPPVRPPVRPPEVEVASKPLRHSHESPVDFWSRALPHAASRARAAERPLLMENQAVLAEERWFGWRQHAGCPEACKDHEHVGGGDPEPDGAGGQARKLREFLLEVRRFRVCGAAARWRAYKGTASSNRRCHPSLRATRRH